MPDLQGAEDIVIGAWTKKKGDHVVEGETIVEAPADCRCLHCTVQKVLALLHPKNKNQRVAIYVVIVAAAILLAATLLGLVY